MKFNGPFSVHNYSIILITLDPIHFIHTIKLTRVSTAKLSSTERWLKIIYYFTQGESGGMFFSLKHGIIWLQNVLIENLDTSRTLDKNFNYAITWKQMKIGYEYMRFFYIIFTCEYTHGVSAVPPDSPCIFKTNLTK
jgi:hypothetical protein